MSGLDIPEQSEQPQTTVSNLAETLCQEQNPHPQPHTQPNCMQLLMTSSCWNPLIMANILSVLNSVMKQEKKKVRDWGTDFLWKQEKTLNVSTRNCCPCAKMVVNSIDTMHTKYTHSSIVS